MMILFGFVSTTSTTIYFKRKQHKKNKQTTQPLPKTKQTNLSSLHKRTTILSTGYIQQHIQQQQQHTQRDKDHTFTLCIYTSIDLFVRKRESPLSST